MNKFYKIFTFVAILAISLPVFAAPFYSNQIGTSTPTNGYVLISNGNGTPATWSATSTLGINRGSPSVGSAGYLQFASSTAGYFNASSSLFWNNTLGKLEISLASTTATTSRVSVQGDGTNPILNLFNGVGTNLLIVLNSGNVGIGTTTPVAKLDVYGTAGSSDIFAVSSSTNARLLTFTSSGNLGIGTNAPKAKLHFYEAGTASTQTEGMRIETGSSGAGSGTYINFTNGVTNGAAGSGQGQARIGGIDITGAGGGLVFYTKIADSNAATLPTQKMIIGDKGSIGFNSNYSSTPYTFQVPSGLPATAGTLNKILELQSNSFLGDNGGLYISFNNTTGNYETGRLGSIGTPGGLGALTFYTPGSSFSEKMRINNAGNVGIGITAPSAKLHVASTTEQLRLGYDGSNYFSTTIGSTGSATFNLTGTTPTFTFNQKIIHSAPENLKNYTVATLPTGVRGDWAYVTDALAPAYLVTVAGGGAVVTPVFYDGATWVAH